MKPTGPAVRYHGGKFRLAPWILAHFPEHRFYTEAFGGAAGVLLQKPRAYSEVYNDLDGDMTNFFRVLRDPEQRDRLIEGCILTAYSREEFELAWEPSDDPVERARRMCVRAQMGFGSGGGDQEHHRIPDRLFPRVRDGATHLAALPGKPALGR